ncbi:MAG: dockerin type I domain-containing protein [Bacillota bacterium]
MYKTKKSLSFILAVLIIFQLVFAVQSSIVSAEAIELPTKGLIGDVNGDDSVNSIDFTIVRRLILDIINDLPVDDDLWAGDVDGDGNIDNIDYDLIKRHILGIIDKFPKEEVNPTPTVIPTPTPTVVPTPTATTQPAELQVESITATNLKEVVVHFNKPVEDVNAAGDTSNYAVKVGTIDKGVALATVSDDGMSVTLTLISAANQMDKIDVTVKQVVGISQDVTISIDYIRDITVPVAESIKQTGANTFEITFSEPVKLDGSSQVLVDNGFFGIASKILSENGRVLYVQLGIRSLPDGVYTVEVRGCKDFANYEIVPKTFSLEIINDTTGLQVESVETTNLKEIIVRFSKALENVLAVINTSNYTVRVGTTDKGVALATVSDDRMSVTLTLANAAYQQDKVDITVKKEVGLARDTVKTINGIIDTTLPVAESIKLTGPRTFEVTFSEPVQDNKPQVLINNGIYEISSKTLSRCGRVLKVELAVSSLSEGVYTVEVSGYKDYAHFDILSKTFDLEYVKDTTAITAALRSTDQFRVVLEFNKVVYKKNNSGTIEQLTNDFFYHTDPTSKPSSVHTYNSKSFSLIFNDNVLPEGDVVITILKSVNGEVIVDEWGNEVTSDIHLTALIVADKEAPIVTKVEALAEDKIEITFSEEVQERDAEQLSNYAITNIWGIAVSPQIALIDYRYKKAVIYLSDKLAEGSYKIEIKEIRDVSLYANKMNPVTISFTVIDKTPPRILDATYVDNYGSEDFIYVTFSEPMATSGVGSVLDKANYRLGVEELDESARIEVVRIYGEKIKIIIPDGKALGGSKLYIGRVADAAGNALVALQTEVQLLPEERPKVISVRFKSYNTIEIEVDKKLESVSCDGFMVSKTVDGLKYPLAAISAILFKDGKTIITATLNSEVALKDASESLAGYKLHVAVDKIKSDTGMYLAEGPVDILFTNDISQNSSGEY